MRKTIEKGITLIALVITIIILLILAGVSISIFREDGIIEKAKWTAYVNEYETINEKIIIRTNEYIIDQTEKNGEIFIPLMTIEEKEEMYVVERKMEIEDTTRSLKEAIKQAENISESDLNNEEIVNLYKIDLEKLGIKAKKSYAINIVSGMLYSIEYQEYAGKQWHTPRIGVEKSDLGIVDKIDKAGTYEMIVDAGQTVSWESIEINYNKYVENSLSIKAYTSDDEIEWTEETVEIGNKEETKETYNLKEANRTQYLKLEVEVKSINGKNAEVEYILVNFYKYREIEVQPEIKEEGVEKIDNIYTVPTITNGQTRNK